MKKVYYERSGEELFRLSNSEDHHQDHIQYKQETICSGEGLRKAEVNKKKGNKESKNITLLITQTVQNGLSQILSDEDLASNSLQQEISTSVKRNKTRKPTENTLCEIGTIDQSVQVNVLRQNKTSVISKEKRTRNTKSQNILASEDEELIQNRNEFGSGLSNNMMEIPKKDVSDKKTPPKMLLQNDVTPMEIEQKSSNNSQENKTTTNIMKDGGSVKSRMQANFNEISKQFEPRLIYSIDHQKNTEGSKDEKFESAQQRNVIAESTNCNPAIEVLQCQHTVKQCPPLDVVEYSLNSWNSQYPNKTKEYNHQTEVGDKNPQNHISGKTDTQYENKQNHYQANHQTHQNNCPDDYHTQHHNPFYGNETQSDRQQPLIVDSNTEERKMVIELNKYKNFAMKCTSVSLDRENKLSAIVICLENGSVYIVDVKILGIKPDLKSILENEDIKKVMFDCRSSADCFFHQHKVQLRGIIDMQLMQYVIDYPDWQSAGWLPSFLKTVERNIPDDTKRESCILKQQRNDYSKWDERPLKDELVNYIVKEITLYFDLYKVFDDIDLVPRNIGTFSRQYAFSRTKHSKFDSRNPYWNNAFMPLNVLYREKGGPYKCTRCYIKLHQDLYDPSLLRQGKQECPVCAAVTQCQETKRTNHYDRKDRRNNK